MAKKNPGKQFEDSFQDSCKKTDFYYLRIKDSASAWSGGAGSKFSSPNPYDMLMLTTPFLWTLELKSTQGSSVSYYADTPWIKPEDTTTEVMVKAHQVEALMKCVKYKGIIAGLVINFRGRTLKTKTVLNQVYFLHINDFIELSKIKGKASINEADCKKYGVEIIGTLKKVYYTYDIKDFVNRAIVKYLKGDHLLVEFLNTIEKRIKSLKEIIEK